MIRDCFDGGEHGITVNAETGEEVDMCFECRSSGGKVKERVYREKIPSMLTEYEGVIDMDKEDLPYLIGDPDKIRFTEELFAYEYSIRQMKTSSKIALMLGILH